MNEVDAMGDDSKKQTKKAKPAKPVNDCIHHPDHPCDCPPEHRTGSSHADHDHAAQDHASHESHDHSAHDHSTHEGHDHSAHDPNAFKRKFWLSFALTIPTLVFSSTVQMLFGWQGFTFTYHDLVPAVLASGVFAYGGWVFLKSGWGEIRNRKPGMMALISLALLVAFGYSLFLTIAPYAGLHIHAMDFWWELAALVTIMLLGHFIEMTAIMRAQNAMGELAKLLPDSAEVLNGRKFEPVAISALKIGDVVLVRPGGSIPADGVIVKGEASINESMVTGESRPVHKSKTDAVLAGTVLATALDSPEGAIRVEVTALGGQTALSRIMRLVGEAQESKSSTQTLADKTAGWLFYVALISAAITAGVWVWIGTQDTNFILERVVTVLVIACPHALGLAVPMVNWVASLKAAKSGILLRNKIDFEAAAKVDVVLFDKTGTLTTGDLAVESVRPSSGSELTTNRLVALVAGLEVESEHAIGEAIIAEAKRRRIKPADLNDLMTIPGVGVSGREGGTRYFAGGPALLLRQNVTITPHDLQFAASTAEAGFTVVYLVIETKLVGLITVGDRVRDNTTEAVQELQRLRKQVAIVSGDVKQLVDSMARRIGVSETFAEVLPQRKIEIVQQLQAAGKKVAMVGDGVNDAPALAQADVGIAIGDGTDVAAESAGILLVSGNPLAVPELIRIAKRSRAKMIQNLWWAAGYNLIAIPLAAGVLMPFGLVLSPALGAILMSLSTIIVAANAQLLRR